MTKKFNLNQIIFITVLILFSLSILSTRSLELNPTAFGGHYTVKVGDSQIFQVYKYYNPNSQTDLIYNVQAENRTKVNIQWSKISTFRTVISAVNNVNGSEEIIAKTTYFISGEGSFTSSYFNANSIVGPVFNFSSEAYSYYSAFYRLSNVTLKLDGNEIITSLTTNLSTNVIEEYTTQINWKTGWQDSYHYRDYDSKTNKLIFEKLVQNPSLPPPQSSYNFDMESIFVNSFIDILVIIALIIAIIVLIMLVKNYQSYSNLPAKIKDSIKFRSFLKKKIKYKKKINKPEPDIKVDKALDMIEEIIEDNNK